MFDTGFHRNSLSGIFHLNRRPIVVAGILFGCILISLITVTATVWAMGMGFPPPPPPELTQRPVIDRIGGLKSPSRMAMSDEGDIYVSDTKRGVVAAFNRNGERIGTLKGVSSPLGIALFDFETTINVEVEKCVLSYEKKLLKLKKKILKIENKLRLAGTPKPNPKLVAKLEAKLAREQARLAQLEADILAACSVPTTVTITRAYVGDESDGSVRIFENSRLVGALGSGSGEFQKPNSITVASDGTVYVVDSNRRHVAVYDNAGNWLKDIGDGVLFFPTDIAINESAGEIYVSDLYDIITSYDSAGSPIYSNGNGYVAVFDFSGAWIRNIQAPLNASGDPAFFRAAGISIDPAGNLYVTDNGLSCLVIMSSTGGLLDIIGYDTVAEQYWTGDLFVPIDSVSDGISVWVSSSRNGQINVYEVGP